ncbi:MULTISPECIES: ATP-binding protein [unclassified Oceanispirochaeta]|uniref:ATP-binding response regulator n=1 Tax=unclassified Oceanispirochaeta TaxID=2635722 RepID=UPI000E08D961|nr:MULTISPECIES: ATP-binding protein [unclassified Oceanispirochaeta]MBF9016373.1 sensor histidine kinase [Oceanispirochaeta sp. M2]NPD72835.1 HAMP domain-containing histidine kinase [Oceanispirochaeta sp. M1]RDG31679.1 sensor histidine kinase [Oceanispirochaeta sp. M1]
MRFSIKKKFRLLVILLVFLPMIITSFLLVSLFKEKILEQFWNEQTDLLKSIGYNTIEKRIEIIEKLLLEYEGDRRLRELSSNSISTLGAEWNYLSRILSLNTRIYYGNEDKQFFISPDQGMSLLYDPTLTLWYRQGQESKGIFWTIPYRSEKNSEVTLTAAIPIRDMDGEFLGVLGVDTLLKDFFIGIKDEALKENSRILALQEGNRVINFYRKTFEPVEYGSLYNWQELLDAPMGRKLIHLEGTGYYAFSVSLDRLDISLISLIPESDINKEIIPFLLIAGCVVLICTLLMMGGIYIVSLQVVRNIESMNRYMSDVAGGKYELQNCIRSKDEFSIMNGNMNLMVDSLARNIIHLEDMNRQKEDLINLRTTLIHIISHNASTPITVLFNCSMELLEENSREDFRQMVTAAGNLKTLMENTMAYLKLEEGVALSQNQLVNLNDITELTCRMYLPLALNKRLFIDVDMEEELTVEGNYFLIKTVLENLFDNAIKYSLPDGIIRIWSRHEGDSLVWCITDNGPGFSEKDRENLYSKFRKLSARPTGGENSTGLGLYLVKELMSSFGGEVILEENAGEVGACFTLRFPLYGGPKTYGEPDKERRSLLSVKV